MRRSETLVVYENCSYYSRTLAYGGVDTEENEHCEICPLSVYRSFSKLDHWSNLLKDLQFDIHNQMEQFAPKSCFAPPKMVKNFNANSSYKNNQMGLFCAINLVTMLIRLMKTIKWSSLRRPAEGGPEVAWRRGRAFQKKFGNELFSKRFDLGALKHFARV